MADDTEHGPASNPLLGTISYFYIDPHHSLMGLQAYHSAYAEHCCCAVI